jgi:hypothetical protein
MCRTSCVQPWSGSPEWMRAVPDSRLPGQRLIRECSLSTPPCCMPMFCCAKVTEETAAHMSDSLTGICALCNMSYNPLWLGTNASNCGTATPPAVEQGTFHTVGAAPRGTKHCPAACTPGTAQQLPTTCASQAISPAACITSVAVHIMTSCCSVWK